MIYRAEVGGSTISKSLIMLGGSMGGSGGSALSKPLILLAAEAEGLPYTTYRPAAFGAARLRIGSGR